MADPNLTESVDRAARAAYETAVARSSSFGDSIAWDELEPLGKLPWRELVAPMVSAAAPLIARQVGEEIAARIEQQRRDAAEAAYCFQCGPSAGTDQAYRISAGIARQVVGSDGR